MDDRTGLTSNPGAADFELQKIATGNGAAVNTLASVYSKPYKRGETSITSWPVLEPGNGIGQDQNNHSWSFPAGTGSRIPGEAACRRCRNTDWTKITGCSSTRQGPSPYTQAGRKLAEEAAEIARQYQAEMSIYLEQDFKSSHDPKWPGWPRRPISHILPEGCRPSPPDIQGLNHRISGTRWCRYNVYPRLRLLPGKPGWMHQCPSLIFCGTSLPIANGVTPNRECWVRSHDWDGRRIKTAPVVTVAGFGPERCRILPRYWLLTPIRRVTKSYSGRKA